MTVSNGNKMIVTAVLVTGLMITIALDAIAYSTPLIAFAAVIGQFIVFIRWWHDNRDVGGE